MNSHHTSPVASVASLAAGIAHELNNSTGLLFAALDYLDGPAGSDKARAVVEEACANAQVLSAALTLLTLEAADMAQLLGGGHRFQLDDYDLQRVQERVAEVTGITVDLPAAAGTPPLVGMLDRSLLQALLICLTARRKRAAAPAAVVSAALTAAPAPAGQRGWVITLGTRGTQLNGHQATLDRLLDGALAHAAGVLAGAAVRLEMGEQDCLAFVSL